MKRVFFPNFCSSSFCLFHVPFYEFAVYQNAFWLYSYHTWFHISYLIWNLQYRKYMSVYKHSGNRSIFKTLAVTACHWTTSTRHNEIVSFPLRRRHLIITIVPAVDVGIWVSLNVIDAPSDYKMRETFIQNFPWKEKVSYGLENTISSLFFQCILLIFLFLNTHPMFFL